MAEYKAFTDEELVKEVLSCYREARKESKTWRIEATELYKFRAGHQWNDADVAMLEEQKRPPVTFNRAGTVIDAVCGNEVSNRQEVRYFPRTFDDAGVNETASQATKWVRDQCNAEDEESDAFEDVVICGMGWTETRVSYDDDPEGKIYIERVDPLEMFWDPASRKHNLEDRTWTIRAKWISKDDLHRQWPDAGEIKFGSDFESDEDQEPHVADPPYYEREVTGYDKKTREVRVLEYQWCEYETVYRVLFNDKIETLTRDQFKKFQERVPDAQSVRQKKKIHYRAFVAGSTLLEKGKCPVNGSTFKAITGKRDKKINGFFGLMRGMKEPQEWANKFFSQILHIINSNSKGGFFYETGALVKPDQAREDLAKPDGLVEVAAGRMNGIKEKTMFQFPASIDRMLEFAISSIRDVPGVNLEMLGLANRDQPGVLEAQRQRQALAVLAPIFSNLRRYRKDQGKLLLMFIRDFIADGRLIRIVGQEGAQTVQLLKEPLTAEYDIVVDQSPTSPNVKTEAWVALTQVLPILQQAGMPVPKEIVDILPLPESLIGKWKEQIKGGMVPPQVQEQIQQLQEEAQALAEENQALKANQEVKVMEVQGKQQQAVAEMQIDMQKMQADFQMEQQKLQEQMRVKMEEISMNAQLEMQRMQQEFALKQQQMELEAGMKREMSMQDMQLKRETAEQEIGLQREKTSAEIKSKNITPMDETAVDQLAARIEKSNQDLATQLTSIMEMLVKAETTPKMIIFDPSGRPIGIKPQALNS